jgi:hemolysin activation/secretion protein
MRREMFSTFVCWRRYWAQIFVLHAQHVQCSYGMREALSVAAVPPAGRTRPPGRGPVFAVALVILAFLTALVPLRLAAAQQNPLLIPLEATINQNAVMRQEILPPPARQRPLRGRLGEPIAGVPPERLTETRFRLAGVDFEPPPAVHLDPTLFPPAWQELVGKEISLHDLGTVLVKIEEIYRQHDYVVIAKAPPQDFSSGRPRIVAYGVYVGELDVKDESGQLLARLDPIFARIKAMRPLRLSALYRELLIAEDLVNGEINAEWFQIESEPGSARLELNITYQRASLLLNFDNYGATNIGPLQASAKARINDALGLFESTDITFLTNPSDPARITLLGFAQTVPLGTTGFSLSYGLVNSWSNPAGSSEKVGLHSEVAIANARINYALLREMDRNVIVTASLNGNNSNIDEQGTPLTRSRARWVSEGVKYDDVFGDVKIVVNPVFLHGIGAFEANAPVGGHAFSRLPVAVLGFYGGKDFGRAFDPGALAGHDLVSATLPITQRIDTGLQWLPRLSVFTFADYGAVWNPTSSTYKFASLSSAGVGLSVPIGERLIATGLVAQPLTHEHKLAALGVEQGTRLRFTLGVKF